MAHAIVYDPELNIAVLVDPDAPAALGPIATGSEGDDPRHSLVEFVEGLGQPPEGMPTWPLFNEWQAYVRAIVDLAEQLVAEADAAEATPGEGETPGPAAAASPEPQEEPTAPSGAEPANGGTGAEVPVTAEEDAELSARIASAPHTPAKDGRVECWLCHGDLQVNGPTGRVECPVCHGEGTVPADDPSQAQ